MPEYFPEGDVSLAKDGRLRSLHKFCSLVFLLTRSSSVNSPRPSDSPTQLLKKIVSALNFHSHA